MRTSRIYLLLALTGAALLAAYGAFMYVYTDHMFAPITLLAQPNPQAPSSAWQAPLVPFIHKVNTPARARKKDRKFGGFEVDVWTEQDKILAAHDARETQKGVLLSDIFAAVKHPAQKVWWLDVKQELSPAHLDAILAAAQTYNIPTTHLFFEVSPGPTAKLLKARNLPLLLGLGEGFEEDNQDPSKRAKLNAQALEEWQEYQPSAVAASFGKYAYLRAYFPHMPKAIYYSATQRPSIKKFFMRRHLQKDPSVRIFMTDEYDWINW